jgi:hypothetical protein
MWLTNLADVIREHTNLRVIEEPGWEQRGHGPMTSVECIVAHHTAAAAKAYVENPYPSLRTVRDGRPGLDGPLAHLGLQRDLAVRVIAAGRCSHAGVVFWPWQSNPNAIGIEAEHDGVSPWPDDLYGAYVELVAGLVKGYRPPHGVWGHKEIAKPKGRKTDPNFPMSEFRADVQRWTGEPEDDMADAETKAQLSRIEQLLAANASLAGKRWAQTQDTLVALSKAEASRYGDVVRRDSDDRARDAELEKLLENLYDDPASPVTRESVAALLGTQDSGAAGA